MIRFILQHIRRVKNWFLYPLNKYIPITYWLWGGHIYIRPQDRCAFNDVFVWRHYDVPLPWKEFRTIIDIGANIGAFTVFARLHSTAHITAIEPEPSNFQTLLKNKPDNTKCIEAAVDSEEGSKNLYISKNAGQHSLYRTGEGQIHVRTITLHEYIRNGCDLLKLDCEGAEYAILHSLSREKLQQIRFILIEIHRIAGEEMEEPKQFLEDAGFRVSEYEHVILCERES